MADGGFCSLSRCTTATADEEHNREPKKMKMTEMTAEEEMQLGRRVVDGKTEVWKRLPAERVQKILAMNPRVPVLPPPERLHYYDPDIIASIKIRKVMYDCIRTTQDDIRRDLDTKGYTVGWITDDEEDGN